MSLLLQGIQAINDKIFKDDRYNDGPPCLRGIMGYLDRIMVHMQPCPGVEGLSSLPDMLLQVCYLQDVRSHIVLQGGHLHASSL